MKRPIMLVRAAALLALAGVWVQHELLRAHYPDFTDPLWLRGGVALMMSGLFLISFAARYGRQVRRATPGVLTIMGLWMQYLAYLNDLHHTLLPFLFFFLIVTGYACERRRAFHLHFATYPVLTLLSVWFTDISLSAQLQFSVVFLITVGISYLVLLSLRQQKAKLEQLNENLRLSQGMLKRAQAAGHIGSWHVDLLTDQITVSEEFYRFFDLDASQPVTSARVFKHYAPADLAQLQAAIGQAMREAGAFDLKLPIRTERGIQRHVRCIGECLYEGGVPRHLYGIMQDITPEVVAEQALRDAKEKAETAAQAKSRFLSTMSHEIRTPMNAVIGLADFLLEDQPRPAQREHLQTLRFSAQHLMHVLNDILDYSKLEAGKVELEAISFHLPQFLRRICHSFQVPAQDKGLALVLNAAPNLPTWVEGDPTRLGQVLNNLLSNALKFTPKGEVRLSAQPAGPGQIHFTVADTGIGIPASKQALIFQTFTQAEVGTTREYGGTGLGLSITRELLNLMGSEITLQSQPGQGSRFAFSLALPPAPIPEAISPVRPLEEGPPARILLVEDNPVNVKISTMFLQKWGHEVHVAHHGHQALEMIRQSPYDLILMDLQMPGMDGITATRLLRAFNPAIPVIGLSAEVDPKVIDEALAAGMNDYLAKPFRAPDLHEKLHFFLPAPAQAEYPPGVHPATS